MTARAHQGSPVRQARRPAPRTPAPLVSTVCLAPEHARTVLRVCTARRLGCRRLHAAVPVTQGRTARRQVRHCRRAQACAVRATRVPLGRPTALRCCVPRACTLHRGRQCARRVRWDSTAIAAASPTPTALARARLDGTARHSVRRTTAAAVRARRATRATPAPRCPTRPTAPPEHTWSTPPPARAAWRAPRDCTATLRAWLAQGAAVPAPLDGTATSVA